jgi:hypothetical protein
MFNSVKQQIPKQNKKEKNNQYVIQPGKRTNEITRISKYLSIMTLNVNVNSLIQRRKLAD